MEPQDKRSKKQLPDTGRAAKGLSVKSLLRFTPPYFHSQARDSHVILKRYNSRAKTKGGLKAIVATAVSANSKPPRTTHSCSVIGLEKPERTGGPLTPISKQKKVLVSCDCGSYTFTFEYANWTWGASKIVHSNGEPAVVTNPQNRPGLCIAKGTPVKLITGESKPIEDIVVGDYVQTLFGPQKVLASAFMGIRITQRLQVEGIPTALRSTPDHKILVIKKGVPTWEMMDDIKVGDSVVTLCDKGGSDLDLVNFNNLVEEQEALIKTIYRNVKPSKVKAVGEGGVHEVFDLEVEKVGHFVANNIIVHNCKHLVVLLKTIVERGD